MDTIILVGRNIQVAVNRPIRSVLDLMEQYHLTKSTDFSVEDAEEVIKLRDFKVQAVRKQMYELCVQLREEELNFLDNYKDIHGPFWLDGVRIFILERE